MTQSGPIMFEKKFSGALERNLSLLWKSEEPSSLSSPGHDKEVYSPPITAYLEILFFNFCHYYMRIQLNFTLTLYPITLKTIISSNRSFISSNSNFVDSLGILFKESYPLSIGQFYFYLLWLPFVFPQCLVAWCLHQSVEPKWWQWTPLI